VPVDSSPSSTRGSRKAAVAVEFDGRITYTDPWRGRSPERVLWEEKRREYELRSLDIRVVRVADADLGLRWAEVERQLGGHLVLPGPTVRRFTAAPDRGDGGGDADAVRRRPRCGGGVITGRSRQAHDSGYR
jgi:hypothetical protein